MAFDFRALCRFLARPVAALILVASLPVPVAQAGMVPTERVIEQTAEPGERAQVQRFLAREDVQRELLARGVDPAEAAARVDSLSDAEISRLAAVIEQDPAGGDVLGTVIGAFVLVFVILLITDLLGVTDVFPFIRSLR